MYQYLGAATAFLIRGTATAAEEKTARFTIAIYVDFLEIVEARTIVKTVSCRIVGAAGASRYRWITLIP
jgi:hypothetical protein